MARVIYTPEIRELKFPVRKYLNDKEFECGICADEYEAGIPYVLVAGDTVCKECFRTELRPQFIKARNDEQSYPVMWASQKLEPSDFPDFSDNELMVWEVRKALYDTPLAKRLLCQHFYRNKNKEEGDKCQHEAVSKADYEAARREKVESGECRYFLGTVNSKDVVTCDDCRGVSCGKCGLPFGFENEADHNCKPDGPTSVLDGIDKTMIRGVDFQLCPNDTCERMCGLHDGCNAMVCDRCHTGFCFICGKAAKEGSRHWAVGNPCPHWGQPHTERAIWDREENNVPPRPEPPLDVPDFGIPLEMWLEQAMEALRYRREIESLENKPSQDALESGNLTDEEEAALFRMDLHRICEARVATGTVWRQGHKVWLDYGPEWLGGLDSMRAGFNRHPQFWRMILMDLSNICTTIMDWGPQCEPFDVQARFEAAIEPGAKELAEYNDEVYWLGVEIRDRYQVSLPLFLNEINTQDPAAWAEWGLDPRVVERWIPRMEVASKWYFELSKMLDKHLGIETPPSPEAGVNIIENDDAHEPGVDVADITLD